MASAASPAAAATRRSSRLTQRIHPGELVSAASAMSLLVIMFALEWYGVDQPPGKADGAERVTAENAWHGLTIVRWLLLITIVVALGSLIVHLTQRAHGVSTDTAGTVTLLGTLTSAVLSYRVLIDLPSPASVVDQKLGSYLGLLCAFGIALGGYHTLREGRARSIAAAQRERQTRPDAAEGATSR